jgi:hypothetical protein
VYCEGSSPTLSHCLITGNLGGGLVCFDSQPTLAFCTIANNGSDTNTGGVVLWNSEPSVTNSIVWGNRPHNVYVEEEAQGIFSYCDVQGALPGTGNLNVNPAFAFDGYWHDGGTPDDPNDDAWIFGDYHLQSQEGRWDPETLTWVADATTSPCINAADPASEFLSEPEPNGSRANMGAYGATEQASLSD